MERMQEKTKIASNKQAVVSTAKGAVTVALNIGAG
jgi:hypothetical protein